MFYVTPEELKQLNLDVTTLAMTRYFDRLTDKSKRPPGAVPVEMLIMSWPLRLPDSDPGSDPNPGRIPAVIPAAVPGDAG